MTRTTRARSCSARNGPYGAGDLLTLLRDAFCKLFLNIQSVGFLLAITIDLAGIILGQPDLILAQWRERARSLPSARNLDTPTLNDHMPAFIADLGAALQRYGGEVEIDAAVKDTPASHGEQRVEAGFDIEEVVGEYHLLRAVIHDLADRHQVPVEGKLRRVLHQVIDGAIGEAVKSFAAHQARDVKRRREEYLAFVAHDLRTPLNAIVRTFVEAHGGKVAVESTEGVGTTFQFNLPR